jgi:TatD DNase family protein
MIDTHCHLTDPRLESQLPDVLARAAASGVSGMVTIGTSVADSRRCLEVCKGRSNVRCAVGVHPGYVAEVDEAELPQLREIQCDASVVAIGEVGLDYHYGTEHKAKQFRFFEYQLNLATEMNKPVIVHCREALVDCLPIITRFPKVRAVFHCFTGTLDEAKRILEAGYWLGFTGVVTFKKSDELREAVKITPIDRLLVETDAPYLSPEPVRKQKVNEPALVMHVAEVVARLKGMTVGELDSATTGNLRRLTGWPPD